MLQAVGISDFEERVYRAVLRRPGSPATSLAHELGVSPGTTRRVLRRLANSKLVRQDGTGWVPAPPDQALGALIHQRESQLATLRAAAPELHEEFRIGYLAQRPNEMLEVLVGREDIHRRAQQARRATRDELLSFDKPPYIAPADFDEVHEERQLLDRAVRVRAIYSQEALDGSPWPDRLRTIRELSRAGEAARTLPSLPIKLTIYDRRMALVPLTADARATESMVVVHPSGLLDGIVALFEAYWQLAHPIEAGGPAAGALGDDEREVLDRLAAGLTDEAIARQLGISTRTVRRRVLRILDALHANTRFQAGITAARPPCGAGCPPPPVRDSVTARDAAPPVASARTSASPH